MYVKRYIKNKNSVYIYHDTIQMEDNTTNLRMICKSHSPDSKIQYHVTGIHNQAKFIGFSAKYDKVKI